MKITISKIAKLANVSKSTVSRALNNSNEISEKTKNRILDIIKKHNYQPSFHARNLAKNRSMTIALIIPHSPQYLFSNSFYSEVLIGITEITSIKGYNVYFIFEKEFDYSQLFRNKQVDGIIFLAIKYYDKNIINLIKHNCPFISIQEHYLKHKVNYIDSLDSLGTYKAVKYLSGLGHKDIAYIGGNFEYCSGINRFRGFELGLKKFNRRYKKEWIIPSKISLQADGEKIMNKLLKLKKIPSALVTFNDLIAIGAIEALKEKGLRVPEDISIVGFDDIQLSRNITPKLTTITNKSYEKGVIAAKRLINLIENKEDKTIGNRILLPVELVVRDSCKQI